MPLYPHDCPVIHCLCAQCLAFLSTIRNWKDLDSAPHINQIWVQISSIETGNVLDLLLFAGDEIEILSIQQIQVIISK